MLSPNHFSLRHRDLPMEILQLLCRDMGGPQVTYQTEMLLGTAKLTGMFVVGLKDQYREL